jgi:hypothetical protein
MTGPTPTPMRHQPNYKIRSTCVDHGIKNLPQDILFDEDQSRVTRSKNRILRTRVGLNKIESEQKSLPKIRSFVKKSSQLSVFLTSKVIKQSVLISALLQPSPNSRTIINDTDTASTATMSTFAYQAPITFPNHNYKTQ